MLSRDKKNGVLDQANARNDYFKYMQNFDFIYRITPEICVTT